MAAHAGDLAEKTRHFQCARCAERVLVQAGATIPPCPNGHTEYKSRMQAAPSRQRSSG
ncbi:hypothetical protein AB0G04_32540 [Actinoplanes sp. NPDC023801]|uniref:hypothetical protein n=1 Tax=Actinoplanes sp. NPDC023801 TaxID=3154595 RepID=UPI0033DA9C05